MMGSEDERFLWFDIAGDTALAWYYVMAHWPKWPTCPKLQLNEGPMRVSLQPAASVIDDLRAVLMQAAEAGGDMGHSAKALLASLAEKTSDRILHDSGSLQANDTRAN